MCQGGQKVHFWPPGRPGRIFPPGGPRAPPAPAGAPGAPGGVRGGPRALTSEWAKDERIVHICVWYLVTQANAVQLCID